MIGRSVLDESQSLFLVMAGPNGAGKSPTVTRFLPAGVAYINADNIAKTLSSEQIREAEMQAARVALMMMDEAEARRDSFATETTLASQTLASRAIRLRSAGYFFHLVYLWTPDPEFSVRRVARRVQLGGHNIPEMTIRRRWLASLRNFFSLYLPIADQWDIIDNYSSTIPKPIAGGRVGEPDEILDRPIWDALRRTAIYAT